MEQKNKLNKNSKKMEEMEIKEHNNLYLEEHSTIKVIRNTINMLDKAISMLNSLINTQPETAKKALKKTEKKLSKAIAKHFSK